MICPQEVIFPGYWINIIPFKSRGWLHNHASFSFVVVVVAWGECDVSKSLFIPWVIIDNCTTWSMKAWPLSQKIKHYPFTTCYMQPGLCATLHATAYIKGRDHNFEPRLHWALQSKFITGVEKLFLVRFLSGLQLSRKNTQSCWLLSTSYSQSLVLK